MKFPGFTVSYYILPICQLIIDTMLYTRNIMQYTVKPSARHMNMTMQDSGVNLLVRKGSKLESDGKKKLKNCRIELMHTHFLLNHMV